VPRLEPPSKPSDWVDNSLEGLLAFETDAEVEPGNVLLPLAMLLLNLADDTATESSSGHADHHCHLDRVKSLTLRHDFQ
jgi:hypothetical protein